MAKFLLVHGSCHGAWCWRDMLPLLNSSGHSATAIDLPCHGADKTPISDATTELYVDAILNALNGPTVLVGHSLAGMFISQAAERDPSNIARLAYVCAWLPENGKSTRDMRDDAPSNLLVDATQFSDDGLSLTFRPDKVKQHFYHDCPPGTLQYAQENLCAEPLKPQLTPVRLGANFAATPKSYIVCEDDRAIDPRAQRGFADRLPEADRYSMACAHSPFFAQPDKLAKILFQIAEGV